MSESLEARVRSLEQWRDHVAQALMYAPEKQPEPKQEMPSILREFPSDLQPLLSAKLTPDLEVWFIKPLEFLHGDAFPRVSEVVRGLNGKYVSAGKDSHFEVPVR